MLRHDFQFGKPAFFQPFQSEQNIENPYLRVFKDGDANKAVDLVES